VHEFDTAVDELVALVRTAARGNTPEELKSAYSDFLLTADPDAMPREWANGRDVVGEAYMRLLSPEHRRASGQVFTPRWAAQVMVGWAVTQESRTLLDPGCGSGVILQAAAGAGPQLRLHGFDVDPVALQMTCLNCAMRGTDVHTRQLDFLRDEVDLRPDCVVANPPYTRHHELDQETKDEIHEGLGARLGLKYTRQASLHALFLARAVEIADDHAKLAFITPSQWLSTTYGKEIRKYVETVASLDAILELPYDFFPNARTSASITFITKGAASKPPHTRTLGRELPDVEEILDWLERPDEVVVAPTQASPGLVPLSNLAKVNRGVATGHNAFFVLSENDRLRLGLPHSVLRHCVTSPRVFSERRLDAAAFEAMPPTTPRWLLCTDGVDLDTVVLKYIAHGEEIGADDRYLTRHRGRWHALKCRSAYPVLFSYLNKNRPHVVLNDSDAVPLNTWLVVEPLDGVDATLLAQALASDFVAESAREKSRHYGHGLWKLEPSELRDLLVPWPYSQASGT